MAGSALERVMCQKVQEFTEKKGHAPRVLLLSETEGTFGHARVTSTLTKHLHEMGAKVIVASGDIDEEIFDFEGALRKLPLVCFKHKNGSNEEFIPNGELYENSPAYQLQRKQKLLKIANDLQPDIVVFEFHPLSYRDYRSQDMETLLEYGKEIGKNLPFVTIARDSTYGKLADKKLNALNHFSHILMRGWPEIRSSNTGPLPPDILAKVEHLGHILANRPTKDNRLPSEQPVLVFSSGSHMPTDKLFFDKVIESYKHSPLANQPWKIVISKECPDDLFEAFQQKAEAESNGNITVIRTYDSKDFASDLANCKAAIVRGSYNITLELASLHKPFVVIPYLRKGKSDLEHESRAKFFAENGIATTITETELIEENGAERLAEKLFQSTQIQPVKEFIYEDGSQFAARLLQIAMKKDISIQEEKLCWSDRRFSPPATPGSPRITS